MVENAWTDELRTKVRQMYLDGNPTEENTTQLLEEISEETGKTINGIRTILQGKPENIYVKKAKAVVTTGTKSAESKTPRTSKADAIKSLHDAIEAAGQEIDAEIIDKMTGKAAIYFAGVINTINK